MTKLSKKQREDRRATLKLLTGVGVGTVVLAGGLVAGMSLLGPSTALSGKTLGARIDEGALRPFAHRLTGQAMDPDVVIIGSSDCGFCRSFVAEGLEDFVAAASEMGLTVDYLALATGPGSTASAAALGCLSGDPVAVLRATYEISKKRGEDASVELSTLIEEQAGLLGSPFSQDCLADGGLSPAARSQAMSQVFGLRGTPSFYVAAESDSSDIRLFSGFSTSAASVRQLQKNRTE